MDGELEDEQETLKGIAAMLLGLAALAELLCILPLPLRALLLPLLRHAEAVTRAFATERAGGALALPLASLREVNGDGCADGLRLARCFRALASMISFFGGLQDFVARRPFRGGPDRRRAQCAAAIAGHNHFMTSHRAMAVSGAGRIDTS